MTLATQPDIEAILGRSLSTDEAARAATLIGMASEQVVSRVGQKFVLINGETVDLTCQAGEVVLPQRPVVALGTVEVDPDYAAWTVDPSAYTLVDNVISLVPPFRAVFPSNRTFPWWFRGLRSFTGKVRVTYSHGFATIPADVVQAVASAVAATLQQQRVNPDGLRRLNLDDASVDYHFHDGPPVGVKVDDADLEALRVRYGLTSSISHRVGA